MNLEDRQTEGRKIWDALEALTGQHLMKMSIVQPSEDGNGRITYRVWVDPIEPDGGEE